MNARAWPRQADLLNQEPTGNPLEVLARAVGASSLPSNRKSLRTFIAAQSRGQRLAAGWGAWRRP